MLGAILLALGVVSAGPTDALPPQKPVRVSLVANAATIRQRDHLLLMLIIENAGSSDIHVYQPRECMRLVRLFCRFDDEWQELSTMDEQQFDPRCEERGDRGRAILRRSSYCEYKALQRHRSEFVFDSPGKYELRASVLTSVGEVWSDSVTITVEGRSDSDLRRIEEAGDALSALQFGNLHWKVSAKLAQLEDVGGNIGETIRDIAELQKYVSDLNVNRLAIQAGDRFPGLAKRFEKVSFEFALNQLAHFHLTNFERNHLQAVVGAMKYDSFARRESLRELRRQVDPLAPQGWTRSDFGQVGDEKVVSE